MKMKPDKLKVSIKVMKRTLSLLQVLRRKQLLGGDKETFRFVCHLNDVSF